MLHLDRFSLTATENKTEVRSLVSDLREIIIELTHDARNSMQVGPNDRECTSDLTLCNKIKMRVG
jgi:hypothetical protein